MVSRDFNHYRSFQMISHVVSNYQPFQIISSVLIIKLSIVSNDFSCFQELSMFSTRFFLFSYIQLPSSNAWLSFSRLHFSCFGNVYKPKYMTNGKLKRDKPK